MTMESDYDAMLASVHEMQSYISVMQRTMAETEQLVYAMAGDWQGDAGIACAAQIVGLKRQFSEILTFTKDLADAMYDFAQKYRDLDLSIKHEFENI